MTPDTAFTAASAFAAVGWVVLGAAVVRRSAWWRDRVAGLAVPAVLALAYAVVVLVFWSGSQGGFGSLRDVATLFGQPWLLLAGWIHYLAFDLAAGAWIARDAERRGLPRWPLAALLPLTFLFGPAGWLGWLALRTVWPRPAGRRAPPAASPDLHPTRTPR